MRILYVEDNPANVSLVKRVAREHELVNYIDGEDALRNFAKDNPDLVLMDIQLSGRLSGLDVVRELRQQGYTVPIIAVTAYAMIGDRERCLAAGCDDYMAKPLPIPDLIRLFERRKQEVADLAVATSVVVPFVAPSVPEVKPETPVPTTPPIPVVPPAPTIPETPVPTTPPIPVVLPAPTIPETPVPTTPPIPVVPPAPTIPETPVPTTPPTPVVLPAPPTIPETPVPTTPPTPVVLPAPTIPETPVPTTPPTPVVPSVAPSVPEVKPETPAVSEDKPSDTPNEKGADDIKVKL